MGPLTQDLRYGLRMLAKNPGFTTVAMITLVLGIGANSALFTLTRTFLVGPHEFPNAYELVHIWGIRTDLRPEDFRGGIPRTGVNGADFLDWRQQALSFEEIARAIREDDVLDRLAGPVKHATFTRLAD